MMVNLLRRCTRRFSILLPISTLSYLRGFHLSASELPKQFENSLEAVLKQQPLLEKRALANCFRWVSIEHPPSDACGAHFVAPLILAASIKSTLQIGIQIGALNTVEPKRSDFENHSGYHSGSYTESHTGSPFSSIVKALCN